jgi:hypothetical protein
MRTAYESLLRSKFPGAERAIEAIESHINREVSDGKVETSFVIQNDLAESLNFRDFCDLVRALLILHKYYVQGVEVTPNSEKLLISWK